MSERIERSKRGLFVSRWFLIAGAAGVLLLVWSGVLGTLVTDFALVAPTIYALAFLGSKLWWDSVGRAAGVDVTTHFRESLWLFLGIFIGLCILVG